MVVDTHVKNNTLPLDQRGKDGGVDVVIISAMGMITVCGLFVVSLPTTVCLFILHGGMFRYVSVGTSVLLVLATLVSPIYKRQILKGLLTVFLLSIGITQTILLIIFPQTNSAAVLASVIVSIIIPILTAVIVILHPPYIQPGMHAHRSAHTRNKPSWSSSFRSTRRQSIIDFTGYDSVASTPTTKLAPDESGRMEGKTNPFWVQALYEFDGANRNELSFKRGERLLVTDYRGNWWRARKENVSEAASMLEGHPDVTTNVCSGFIPSNFIQVLRKARVMPAASQKKKGSRRRHSMDGMDSTAYLPVLPGQIVEVLDSTPINTTILDYSEDHIEGIPEESECWIVRGVDARVGRVPKTWLEILGEHHDDEAKDVETNEEAGEAFEDAIEK